MRKMNFVIRVNNRNIVILIDVSRLKDWKTDHEVNVEVNVENMIEAVDICCAYNKRRI